MSFLQKGAFPLQKSFVLLKITRSGLISWKHCMKTDPFISVIIPCYNRAGMIAKTIISLQNQEYQNYELIVVDDGSTDNTEQVVKKLADKRTIYYKKLNEERAAARNYGAKLAKGNYLNFFDSD